MWPGCLPVTFVAINTTCTMSKLRSKLQQNCEKCRERKLEPRRHISPTQTAPLMLVCLWVFYYEGQQEFLLLFNQIWAEITVTDNKYSWLIKYQSLLFYKWEKKLNKLPIVTIRMNNRARSQEQFSLCPKVILFFFS